MATAVLLQLVSSFPSLAFGDDYISAVGDPGMRRDGLRVAFEAWNQCNEVGYETPGMGSPRAADCFDVYKAFPEEGDMDFCLFQLYIFLYMDV